MDASVLLKMRLLAALHESRLEEALEMAKELGEGAPRDQMVAELQEWVVSKIQDDKWWFTQSSWVVFMLFIYLCYILSY